MSTLINNATIKVRRDTSSSWTTNNPTPNQGEICLETDTGNMKIGDGSTAWNDLEYRQQLPFTYDLTSANKTHTLPEITGAPQTVSVYWTNGGTYKLTLAVTDGATVGGETASTWEGEGEGHILVESDGSNWQVREYEDSGNNSNGEWKKERDGTLKCHNKMDSITMIGGPVNGLYYDKADWTFPHPYNTSDIIHSIGVLRSSANNMFGGEVRSVSTTTLVGVTLYSPISGAIGYPLVTAIGTWK